MKESGQVLEVTLTVHGRLRTFSEQELIAILEEHFSNEAPVTQKPTEGQWFEVNLQTIDQSIFERPRKNRKQEKVRKLIQQAFSTVKSNPQIYCKKFKTMMPIKNWEQKTAEELEQLACKLGDRCANWVEQALEWAQRICNGESWEDICNNVDTAAYYRLVAWKDNWGRIIGGSRAFDVKLSSSHVFLHFVFPDEEFDDVVPLIVSYDK